MDQLQFLSKNVLWFCDRCLCSFDDWKKKLEADKADSLALARDIATIKTQVADIIETIGSYSSMLSSSPLSTTAVRHSTPIQTSKVLDGTNSRHTFTNEDMQSDVHDDRLQSTQIADDTNANDSHRDESCLLFLTNIDPQVTEREVKLMVCQCLNAPLEDLKSVKKLVPKGMQNLDYVSYKIELNVKWKHRALEASTWPCGIKFREFIRQSTPWKPISPC